MTDTPSIITQIRELLPKVSEGPWHAGHLCDDDHPCNCRGVVNEGYAGGICTVHVDNGLPVGEGGNDSPPLSEAKANLLWLAILNPSTVTALLDRIDELERERDEWRKDFNTLCKAIVGETGLSAIEEATKLRKRAEPSKTRLAEAAEEIERLRTWSRDNQMLAYKWQQAHDCLKAGLPYSFPTPADLPEAISEFATLRSRIATLEKALQPFADAIYNDNGDIEVNLSVDPDHLIKAYFVLRRAGLAEKGSES